jgi:hypothetical protein
MTILPVYISHFTSNPILIGLIPFLNTSCYLLPQLFASKWTLRLPRKKFMPVNVGLFSERLPIFLMPVSVVLFARNQPARYRGRSNHGRLAGHDRQSDPAQPPGAFL